MIMFYFSGTGNSKYVAELFCQNNNIECHSIEERIDFEKLIKAEDTIAFCYPIYFSRVPKIMREFVAQHLNTLKGKKIIIFCAQFMMSGDGTRAFAKLFPKNYIDVIYTEHFFMPNNMPDVPLLPIANDNSIKKSLARTKRKMEQVCRNIQDGKIKKRGFSIISRLLGLPQSLILPAMERRANRTVSVDSTCTLCGLCVEICPMDNFLIEDKKITHRHRCTMCYRCINKCPEKSINVLVSAKIRKQYKGI